MAELEAVLVASPELVPAVLRNLGSALMTSDAALRKSLGDYLVSVTRAHAERVAPSFGRDDLRLLVSLQLVDPLRYVQDAAFRARVDGLLPRTLAPSLPRAMREASLAELSSVLGIEYTTHETLARAWELVPRASGPRKVAYTPKSQRFLHDAHGTIEASIVSLSSEFFSADEATRFLTALRASAPARRILVLADPAMRAALSDVPVEVIDSYGRPFTPWPRDPFAVTRTADGGVVFVNRPNRQPNREDDANMVRALIAGLPAPLDRAWKEPRWTVAPMPFHNGHVLVLPDAAWISIHSVEIRALEILKLKRVPAETFGTAEGVRKYVTAVQQAAKELETLYGKPVRFVHALPAKDTKLMRDLGGGGGFDLDSLITVLPGHALVGDTRLGAQLARGASWSNAHRLYGFAGDASTLGARIAEAQTSGRAPGLQRFLDAVAGHLASQGMTVTRVPLLNVPYALLADSSTLTGTDFLLTWNNVVLDGPRAAGFASGLPEGDAAARAAFSKAGYELDLLPPLVKSILLNGGWRCASNHVRKPV